MRSFVTIVVLIVSIITLNAQTSGSYKVDPDHSNILTKVQHMGAGYVWGRFDTFSGDVNFSSEDPSKSSINVQISADSIDTHQEKRDQHLKSPDFFNAKEFAVITFKSSSVKKVDDKTYEVAGDITLHGVTKPITTQVKVTGAGKGMKGEERVGTETTFNLKRSDFGMNFMPGGIGDDVQVVMNLEGIKQAPGAAPAPAPAQ
jgi:polyisoprenoid-binding protein YceI